jgi:hypothetical protein
MGPYLWVAIVPTTDSSNLLCRLRRRLSGHRPIPDRVRARAQCCAAAQGCCDYRTGGMKNLTASRTTLTGRKCAGLSDSCASSFPGKVAVIWHCSG